MASTAKLLPLEPDVHLWGRLVAARRKQLDMSQTTLGRRLADMTGQKLDQSYVSKVERGDRPPTEAQRTAIARILASTVWALFPYPEDVT